MLGEERAQFACAFGRLGVVSEAVAAHESAGLEHVEARVLHGSMDVRDEADEASFTLSWLITVPVLIRR